MNIYKILTFDGYNTQEVIITGFDAIQAIQSNGSINQSQIIKLELIGSKNQQDYSDTYLPK